MKKSDVSDYRFVLRKAMVDWEFINDGSWYVSRGVIKLQEGVVLANIISRHYDGDGVNSPSYRICSTSLVNYSIRVFSLIPSEYNAILRNMQQNNEWMWEHAVNTIIEGHKQGIAPYRIAQSIKVWLA